MTRIYNNKVKLLVEGLLYACFKVILSTGAPITDHPVPCEHRLFSDSSEHFLQIAGSCHCGPRSAGECFTIGGATTPIPIRWNRYGSFLKSSGRASRPEGLYSRFSANAYRGARQGTREPCGMVNSRALCIVLWSVVCLGGVSAVPERIRHPFLTCKTLPTPNSGELHTNPSPIPIPYTPGRGELAREGKHVTSIYLN